MCLVEKVYCFHCGKQFQKKKEVDFEDCPHCGKGFSDLSQEAQFAVLQVLKPFGIEG